MIRQNTNSAKELHNNQKANYQHVIANVYIFLRFQIKSTVVLDIGAIKGPNCDPAADI